MKNTRLIHVLKTLSASEFKRFGELVYSPFFNKNDKLKTFYSILKDKHPDFGEETDRYEIYSGIYPGEKFNDERMRNLISDLYKLTEKFLSYMNYETDPFDEKKYLLMELHRRELESIFHSCISDNKFLDSVKVKDEIYYLKKYILNKILRTDLADRLPNIDSREYIKALKNEIDNFVRYFVIKMLKYYSLISSEEQRINIKIDKFIYEEVMSGVKNRMEDFKDAPAVEIFYNLLLMNQNKDKDTHFSKLQKLLKANPGFELTNDYKHAHMQLHNFCSLRCTGMESDFKPNCFSFMKSIIKDGKYPLETKYISDHTFICLATAGLNTKNFEWTNKFIHDYRKKLSPTNRDNTYKYINAVMEFHKGNYSHAIQSFSKVISKDFYYYLRTRSYMMKCYYELNDSVRLVSAIDSFKKYLIRNEIMTENMKIRYNNYLRFLNSICITKEGKNKIHKNILIKELDKCEDIEDREWLYKKINGMN